MKKYAKEAEALENKLSKMYEIGKKASTVDSEIEAYNRELKHMKKNKLQVSKNKNMDVKTIIAKTMVLTRERDKLKEDFSKSRSEVESSFKELNDAKRKAFTSFNGQSENIDVRINENLLFFRKKLNEAIQSFKLTSKKPDYTFDVIESEMNKADKIQEKLDSAETSVSDVGSPQKDKSRSSSIIKPFHRSVKLKF